MTTVLIPRHNVSARRLSPFSLFDDFDRLFARTSRGATPRGPTTVGRPVTPRIDVHETDAAWLIDAELPGLDQNEIEVSIDEGVLTIAAERKREHADEAVEKGYRHVERYHGSFRRSLRLPDDVDGGAVKAAYKNGVLSLTVPKPPKVEPEVLQIPVSVE